MYVEDVSQHSVHNYIDHIDRCQKQKPTNITFSCKDQLKFEDYHMKVPVPIRVYADFVCIIQPKNIQILPKYYLNKFQLQHKL